MASICAVSAIDSHEKVQKIGINARWSFEYGIWILNAVENTNQSELQHMLHRIPLYILRVIPTPQLYRSLHKSCVGCATPYIKPLRKLYCVAVQSHKTNLYLHFKDLCLHFKDLCLLKKASKGACKPVIIESKETNFWNILQKTIIFNGFFANENKKHVLGGQSKAFMRIYVKNAKATKDMKREFGSTSWRGWAKRKVNAKIGFAAWIKVACQTSIF